MGAKMCAVAGCVRTAESRGWCHAHYLRWQRHGDVRADIPLRQPKPDHCTVDDCFRSVARKGLCDTHYKRLREYGDVQAHIPIRDKQPKQDRPEPPPARLRRDLMRRTYENVLERWQYGELAWRACLLENVTPAATAEWLRHHRYPTDIVTVFTNAQTMVDHAD
jgi:hypothetical protein